MQYSSPVFPTTPRKLIELLTVRSPSSRNLARKFMVLSRSAILEINFVCISFVSNILQSPHPLFRRVTFRKPWLKAFLFRLDTPLVRIPKVDIQFTAVIHGNLPLLKTLAPAVRSLSGDKLFQSIHFGVRQFPGDAAFRNAPELPVTFLHGEDGGAHLAVNAVGFIIPMRPRSASSGIRFFTSAAVI